MARAERLAPTWMSCAAACRTAPDATEAGMASVCSTFCAARYRRVQQKLEELEQMVIDARFECTGPGGLTTTEYEHQLTGMLKLIRSIDEANES